MIRDLLRERAGADERVGERADVCVVGAGAAGIVLAVELARLGKRVVLLEGGGATIEESAQEPYRSEVTGLPHTGIHTGRFRAEGGTTTKWGGQILELDDADFAVREWVPGSGWPLGKAELTGFYERALELEGLAGRMRQDVDVWRAVKQKSPQFEALTPYFSRWCPEPNFAVLHHDQLAGDAGITVWLHANVTAIDLDGERVVGVRARSLGGEEVAFLADEYVFAMGAIESSRFFLQPRAGGLPWNESGLLGRHFQDHIDSNGATITPLNQRGFHALFDNVFLNGLKYHPKVRLNADVQKERRTLNVAGTMLFVSEADETLARMKGTAKHLLRGRLGAVTAADAVEMAKNLPLLARQSWRYAVEHRAYNPAEAKILLRVHCEQEPLGASAITLSDERDALGMLRTRLDWRISGTELETIRTYVKVAQKALAGVADVVAEPSLALGADHVARCDDSNHHMGGMKMAASARAGVVDTDLRLHGTSNAYVCSSAVFPTSGYSNPTHTLLALTVRLAEHLS